MVASRAVSGMVGNLIPVFGRNREIQTQQPEAWRGLMKIYMIFGIIMTVALVGILLVGFQVRDRLEKIAGLLEKK